MARDGNSSRLLRMMVLTVAAFGSGETPSFAFQTLDQVAYLHCASLAYFTGAKKK
jgi:hypothetical protein